MKETENKARFANIKMDYWFKRSFGSETYKRLLELLLGELLPERKIASLKFVTQEHLNPDPGKKGICVDVECTDEDGSRFVVEMQVSPQDAFYDRAVFNSSFAIQEQIASGKDWSFSFPPVYFIGLMDFSFHEDSDRVLYRYLIKEDTTGEVMTRCVQYLFLELPNCGRALTDNASVLDNFCYVMHNIQSLEERPDGLAGEFFDLLFNSAEIATFTPQEKRKYELDMRTERDLHNQIEYARKMGRKEGEAIGEAKGEANGARKNALETARKMLADGLPQELVSKYSGLPQEDLESL